MQIELERGAEDCFGPGSFLELSRSVAHDLMATQPAEIRLHSGTATGVGVGVVA